MIVEPLMAPCIKKKSAKQAKEKQDVQKGKLAHNQASSKERESQSGKLFVSPASATPKRPHQGYQWKSKSPIKYRPSRTLSSHYLVPPQQRKVMRKLEYYAKSSPHLLSSKLL